MKGERRHELQENTLARKLGNLPVALRLYADKILLIVLIVLAAWLLVRWRVNAGRERLAAATEALSAARGYILELNRPRFASPQQLAELRSTLRAEAENALRQVSSDVPADNTALRSAALLAKGDLYWALANLPELPGAATQPALKFSESRDELLKQADESYQQLLSSYGSIPRMKASALFGLAAIDEDRRDFAAAAQKYDQIKQSNVDEMYKQLADERMKVLPALKQPMLFGTLTTKPAALTQGVPASSTQPTTQSAVPPATQPATTQPN